MTADDIIALLRLAPHPEGGHFRQTWEGATEGGARASGTCIYFLLKGGERSHWHRVDAAEIWHFYAGSPLRLMRAAKDEGPRADMILGADLGSGQRPQGIVEPGHWQAAESLGGWTLVGCTVSPGFRFEGFELAAPGFDIAS